MFYLSFVKRVVRWFSQDWLFNDGDGLPSPIILRAASYTRSTSAHRIHIYILVIICACRMHASHSFVAIDKWYAFTGAARSS